MRVLSPDFAAPHCKSIYPVLSTCWFLGLIFGSVLALLVDERILLLIQLSAYADVTITGLVTVALIPYLICFLGASTPRPVLLYAAIFLKALTFALVASGVLISFSSSSGPLLVAILLFSDFMILPVFWWSLLQTYQTGSKQRRRNSVIYAIYACLIISIDYFLIMPFWAELTSFQKG